MKRAVFLDRDGVLVEDVNLLTNPGGLRILPGVPQALGRLKRAGYFLIVVSNQTVVARGLATEDEVRRVQVILERRMIAAGGPGLDGFYFCPHHPNATLPAYRVNCGCRKPKPGMFTQAAHEHGLKLPGSFAVGDRITDIIAGARAGCRTVLVQTGMHGEPPIKTVEPLDVSVLPDHVCDGLAAAADWILGQGQMKHED